MLVRNKEESILQTIPIENGTDLQRTLHGSDL